MIYRSQIIYTPVSANTDSCYFGANDAVYLLKSECLSLIASISLDANMFTWQHTIENQEFSNLEIRIIRNKNIHNNTQYWGHKSHIQFIEFTNTNFEKFKMLFSTLIIIGNVSWAANQHIRMISGGSCATEDWSNYSENSAFHHRNK